MKIKDIKERAGKATPGPWTVDDYPNCSEGATPMWVAQTYRDGTNDVYVNANTSTKHLTESKQDAEFIAHARTDVPLLVDKLEKAVELLKEVRWSFGHTGECYVEGYGCAGYECPDFNRKLEAFLDTVKENDEQARS